jgi:tetratricopeptide (TPR) repeat protein
MLRIPSLFAVISSFLLFVAAGSVCPAVLAAEPPWTEIHGQHFSVITDAGEKRGREVALRLEQMRALFGTMLMKARLNMSVPLTVIALKSDQTYAQVAPIKQGHPLGEPGFLLQGEDHNYIVLNLSEEEPWRAIAHDFAHLLLNYNYPPTQGWFDEGFAEYFSSVRLTDRQVEIGADPELSPPAKENLLGVQKQSLMREKSFTELLSVPVWLSTTDLFAVHHDASRGQEGSHHTLFYAQSWIVMHYLLNKQKLPEAGTYFDLVQNQQLPIDEAISKAFGMSPRQLEQAVKDYFASLTAHQEGSRRTDARESQLAVHQFPTPVGADDLGATVTQLPDAEARAMLGDVMARIPERREQGIKNLEALAAGPTPNEVAHRALAWARIQSKDFEPAAQELSSAAELNSRDAWVRYYLSVAKYRMAESTGQSIQGLANMMQDLRAVLDWYPEFAEAYNMLAMARVEGGGINSALESIRAAIQLSPRNEQYVYNLGEIYVSGKKWDAARGLFERLKTSSNPQIASAARAQLQEMQFKQKYGIPMQRPTPTNTDSKPADIGDSMASHSIPTPTSEKVEPEAPGGKENATAPMGAIQFIKGKLMSVDCSSAPAAVLTVVAGTKTLKLRTPDYKSLTVVGADAFSCSWQNREVAINYRSSGKTSGDLVSLEVH